jgi:acetyl-CoA C-acetyltransferase
VNQAAAFIVTSLERARALGVSSDKIVHLWGGAAAQETEDFLDRDSYDHSTAQDAVLNGAVNLAGGDATRFDFAELYSCFPVVPKMALNTLGLRAGVLPTVTGGISFFGGPMNNYMSHAVCAMVRELRAHEGALGLLYGQGGVFNKHHAVVVSASPAPAPLSPDYSVQCAADALRRPTPLRIERYDGPASVETWTVIYDRDGNPKQGVVVARTNRDERLIARADPTDQETLDRLTDLSCSAIGTEGQVRTDVFGDLIWSCSPAPRYRPNPTFCEVERDGPITLVIINRPDAMNALHSAANAELAEVFDDFAVDPDQWIAILTGAGEKAFSAGNDLKYSAAAQARGEFVRVPLTGFAGLTNRFNLPKPVIAAVNGVAMGGGFEIALACDLVIASDNATFALPEPKVGLAALAGGLHRLPRQIGLKPAMGMILTGRAISAKEALALGVVNEVTTPDDLLPAAKRWATDILACSPMSIRASKAAVQKGLLESDIEGAIASQRLEPNMKALFRSRDLYEGPRAFAEKRKPRWEGR